MSTVKNEQLFLALLLYVNSTTKLAKLLFSSCYKRCAVLRCNEEALFQKQTEVPPKIVWSETISPTLCLRHSKNVLTFEYKKLISSELRDFVIKDGLKQHLDLLNSPQEQQKISDVVQTLLEKNIGGSNRQQYLKDKNERLNIMIKETFTKQQTRKNNVKEMKKKEPKFTDCYLEVVSEWVKDLCTDDSLPPLHKEIISGKAVCLGVTVAKLKMVPNDTLFENIESTLANSKQLQPEVLIQTIKEYLDKDIETGHYEDLYSNIEKYLCLEYLELFTKGQIIPKEDISLYILKGIIKLLLKTKKSKPALDDKKLICILNAVRSFFQANNDKFKMTVQAKIAEYKGKADILTRYADSKNKTNLENALILFLKTAGTQIGESDEYRECKCLCKKHIDAQQNKQDIAPAPAPAPQLNPAKFDTYKKMYKMRMPKGAVRNKMIKEGVSTDDIDAFFNQFEHPPTKSPPVSVAKQTSKTLTYEDYVPNTYPSKDMYYILQYIFSFIQRQDIQAWKLVR